MEMERERFWNEGMDGKRFVLWLMGRLWIILVSAAGGALLTAFLYWLAVFALAGGPEYRVTAQYYVYYNMEEFRDVSDYYNSYTWGSILKTDPILDPVMELLPKELTRQRVQEAVTTDILSDPRLLTIYVTTEDAGLSEQIASAFTEPLARFGEDTKGLDGIELWRQDPAETVKIDSRMANAALLGGVLGTLLSFFVLAAFYLLEDSFYLEEDFEKRYPYPVLGILTRQGEEAVPGEFMCNADFLLQDVDYVTVTGLQADPDSESRIQDVAKRLSGRWNVRRLTDSPYREKDWKLMRESGGVVLALAWGAGNGKLTNHVLREMELQKVPLAGVVLTGADSRFLAAYYRGRGGLGRKQGGRPKTEQEGGR